MPTVPRAALRFDNSTKRRPSVRPLIRPSATFSPAREKEQSLRFPFPLKDVATVKSLVCGEQSETHRWFAPSSGLRPPSPPRGRRNSVCEDLSL